MSDTPEQTVQVQAPGASAAPGAGSASGDGAERAPAPHAHERRGEGADGGAGAPAPPPGQVAGEALDDGDVAEIEEDLDELVAVGAQRDEYLALAQRTQADFENYRKRVARESALALQRGVAKLAKELLPALDNLDRALEAAAVDDPLLQGVRLVREELAAALARVGVESFSPAGEPFDPALHEAMAQQPVQGLASGTVAEVYQPGYRLGESIIRPARVVVAA
ncbi:MAG TPA: nucleotide exchange factor GrpE [Solirubrobacteraceae bacterium]|nr:nucleotide exchange factor GrpE [Solirubrobacteraceae bacterium]